MIDIPTFTLYIWPISDKICGRFSTQNCLFLFGVLINSDSKNMQQCLSGISFLECITLSGMIVSIPHAVVDGLIVYYFAVYFGNIWNFNLLRLTWLAFCHSEKLKNVRSHHMKKFIPGSFFQEPKFRITKAFHKWHGVLMCFVSFASQVCPKRKPERAEATKIGINGFGRIGRMVFQAGLSKQIGFPPLVIPVIWDCQILPGHLRPEPLGNQVGRGGCG